MRGWLSAGRFVRGFVRPDPELAEEQVRLQSGAREVEGTLYRPAGGRPAPAWVVLHGVTVPGRRHPSLVRFARALAAAGHVVLLPDVPVWRALEMHPAAAGDAIAGADDYLATRPDVLPGPVNVVGFSVGATQALIAAAEPRLRERVDRVVGFGGYCDLKRTLVCMCTGEHEWRGTRHRVQPDPYGRWLIAGAYLTRVPGFERMDAVAAGLRRLGREAGVRGVAAWADVYDELKLVIRRTLSPAERAPWDLLAPPAGRPPADVHAARELALWLTDAALAADPRLDPRPALPSVRARVVLAHGRDDRLIPFTETLRLREALPPALPAFHAVTALFAHSGTGAGLHPLRTAAEAAAFLRLLRVALG